MFLNFARRSLLVLSIGLFAVSARGQELRKIVANPAPVYPEMAKRMQLTGVVKIEVVIAPDGKIKDSKVIGGHPVLVDAAMTALHDWKLRRPLPKQKHRSNLSFTSDAASIAIA
jgi:TonB family protein